MMHHNFLAYPLSLVIWLFGLVPFFFFFFNSGQCWEEYPYVLHILL